MADADRQVERLTELEMLVMHLQHDLEQMNEVVLRQQAEIDKLKTTISRLQEDLSGLAEDQDGAGPPLERPPHY
jgi:SlyX protein